MGRLTGLILFYVYFTRADLVRRAAESHETIKFNDNVIHLESFYIFMVLHVYNIIYCFHKSFKGYIN